MKVTECGLWLASTGELPPVVSRHGYSLGRKTALSAFHHAAAGAAVAAIKPFAYRRRSWYLSHRVHPCIRDRCQPGAPGAAGEPPYSTTARSSRCSAATPPPSRCCCSKMLRPPSRRPRSAWIGSTTAPATCGTSWCRAWAPGGVTCTGSTARSRRSRAIASTRSGCCSTPTPRRSRAPCRRGAGPPSCLPPGRAAWWCRTPSTGATTATRAGRCTAA